MGRTRLIRANSESPLIDPLRQILLVATGPVALLAEELADVDGIDLAFLYGSYAARLRGVEGPPPQDIDVMIVGEPDPESIYAICDRVEAQVGRPVNPTILTRDEFYEESGFLEHIASNPTVPVVGKPPWQ